MNYELWVDGFLERITNYGLRDKEARVCRPSKGVYDNNNGNKSNIELDRNPNQKNTNIRFLLKPGFRSGLNIRKFVEQT